MTDDGARQAYRAWMRIIASSPRTKAVLKSWPSNQSQTTPGRVSWTIRGQA